MKTEASRKPVPMDEGLAGVFAHWRGIAQYNQDGDYIFASPDQHGTQPYRSNAAMENHIRPAAVRAGIQKHVGWRTFRHTFGTLVNSNGADVATTQALMVHANASITMDRYVQAVTPRSAKHNHASCKCFRSPKRSHAVDGNLCNCLNRNSWALNSAVECHLHTVEVIGSNPIAPTTL